MKEDVWALVMSSTQARIIKGVASGAVDDVPEMTLCAEHKDLREIMSGKPGRSFSSVGSGRSAMEYASDPVRDAKRAFVVEVVSLLHQHFAQHDFKPAARNPARLAADRDRSRLYQGMTRTSTRIQMKEINHVRHRSENHETRWVQANHP
jgi:Protein required for attachment to host cells